MKNKLYYLAFLMLGLLFPGKSQLNSLNGQDYVKQDFPVSDLSDFFYSGVRLSVNETGEMATVWETAGSGSIHFKTISSQGQVLSDQKSVLTPFTAIIPQIAHSDNGNFMIIYAGHSGSWSMIAQVFDSTGVAVGDTLTVDRNTTEIINASNASLFSDKNNEFAVFLPGLDSLIVEKISSDGAFLENTIVLKPESESFTELKGAMTWSGELILIWIDYADDNIWGRMYSADGSPSGEKFQVSDIEAYTYSSGSSLAVDSSGNMVVVWTNSKEDHLDIYSQELDKEGVKVGESLKITDSLASYTGMKMSVDMDTDGDYVVTWPDYRTGDTSFIYLQQVNNLGEPVGGNYRATSINNVITPENESLPSQVDPSVQILRDTIYLAWINSNKDIHYRSVIYANLLHWIIPDNTGIKAPSNTQSGIKVYPNPTNGMLSLRIDQKIQGPINVRVFNSSGAVMYNNNTAMAEGNGTIDLSFLPDGMYIIHVTGDRFQSFERFSLIK